MGKDKEKPEAKAETPQKPPKSQDSSTGKKKEAEKSSTGKAAKPPKKRTGLFSKFRKSTTDLSEWSKTDEKLQTAVDNDDVAKVQNFLAKKGVDPTKVDPKGQTAFHRAAEQGKIEIVETMIAYKANLDAQDVQGRSPLSCAVKYGRSEVADRLLQEKNNTGSGDLKKQTPLHHATIGGSAECVRLLIRYHAPVNQPDKDGRTALHYSSLMGYLNICRELVDAGINVNAKDGENRTPLMCAAEYGQVQVCELLVKKGASTVVTDINGNNAAQWAAKSGFTEIKGILEKAPTQANWSIGPGPSEEESEDAENRVEVLQHSGRESPDITPYEGEYTREDKVTHGVMPLQHVKDISDYISPSTKDSKESLHSSVKVNYSDDDDICDLVPMEEMRKVDHERMEELPVDVPDHFSQQHAINSVSDTQLYVPDQQQNDLHDSDSVQSFEASLQQVHEIIQNVDQSAVLSRPSQEDAVSQDTIDKEKYDELEEEHDQLSSELQQVMLENRKLQQRVGQLETQLGDVSEDGQPQDKQESGAILVMEDNPLVNSLEAEISDLREEVEVERDKNEVLMDQIAQLRKTSRPKDESDLSGDDSWNDSAEEESFSKKGKSRGSQAMQLAVLKSQVLELTQENGKLRDQIQLDSSRLHTDSMDTSHSLTDLRELSQFEGIQLAHEQEVRALRDRIGTLEHKLQSFSDKLNEVEDEKFAVVEEKDLIQGQYEELLESNLKIQQELDGQKPNSPETGGQSADSNLEAVSREVEKLRRENHKLLDDREGLMEINERLQEEKRDLLEQMEGVEDLVQFRQQVHEEAEHLESEKQQLTQLMEDIRGMAEQDKQIKSKQQQRRESAPSSPTEVVIEVQSQGVDPSSPLASLTLEEINMDDLQASAQRSEARNKEIAALEAQLKKKKSEILGLEKQTATAVNDLSQIKADTVRERKELKAMQQEVSGAKDELNFVEKALSVQKEELKKTEHSLKSKKQKEKQKAEEEGDRDISQTESSSILDQLETLNQALAVKRTEFSVLQTQKENLLSENQQALDHKEAAEAEIKKLRDERQFLLSEQGKLENVISSERAAVDSLEKDISQLKQQKGDVEKLRTEKEDKKSQLNVVEVIEVQQVQTLAAAKPPMPEVDTEAFDALVGDNKELQSANTKLKDQIRQLMDSNDDLSKRNAALSEEMEQALLEKQDLSEKEVEMNHQLQKVVNVTEQLTQEKAGLEERLNESARNKEILEITATEHRTDRDKVLEENKRLTKEQKKVQQQLMEAEGKCKRLLEERGQLEKKMSDAQETKKGTETKIERLASELKQLEEKNKDLALDCASFQDNLQRVSQSNKDLQKQMTATELKCQTLSKENDKLSSQNQSLAKDMSELSDKNNNLKTKTKELSEKVGELRNQMKGVGERVQRQDLDAMKQECEEMKEENKKLKTYIGELEYQSGISAGVNYMSEYEKVLSENQHLLAELTAMREENNPIEVTVLRNQNEELHTERQQLETNNSALQKLIDSLNVSMKKEKKVEEKKPAEDNEEEVSELEKEIQKLLQVRDTLQLEKDQLIKEANVVNSNMATLQKASEEIIREQQQEKALHEDQIAKLLNSNEDLLTKLENMQQETNTLQSQHLALQKSMNQVMQERKKETEREINKELANTKDKLSLVQKEKLALLDDLQSLQREIDANRLKEQMRQSIAKDAPDKLVSLQAELQKERKQKEEWKKQSEELMKEKEKQNAKPVTEVIEIRTQPVLQSSRGKNDTANKHQEKNDKGLATVEGLKATNGKLTAEIEQLKKELKSAKKHQSKGSTPSEHELHREVEQLTDGNKGLQVQVSTLHVQIEGLKEENEAKVHDLMEEQDMLLEKIKGLESSAKTSRGGGGGSGQKAGPAGDRDKVIKDLEDKCGQLQLQLTNKDKQVQELKDGPVKIDITSKKRGGQTVASDAYLASLREENASLREKLSEAEGGKKEKSKSSKQPVMNGEEDNQGRELEDQLQTLRVKLVEAEKHHHEVVNTYRSHLLAAVQGCMDQDVKKSLKHILSLRNNNKK